MKRVYKNVMSVFCMAMTVFSVATTSVNVSAAGYFDPTVKEQIQPRTTTNKTSVVEEEETTSTGSSYLTKAQQSVLDKLDTDYSKVNWGVQYSPKGMGGIIISVAPYMDGKYPYLLVGITNIYDEDVCFSASGYAKGRRGQEVSDITIYEDAIRPGNTVVKALYCDDTPTGEIYWDSMELPKVYSESTYWEGNWSLSKDKDGYYQIDYDLSANDYSYAGYVTARALDKNGDILDVAYDYNSDYGYYATGTIQFFEKEFNSKVADVAMFTNPLIAK